MEIVQRTLASIRPYQSNPRQISHEAVNAVANSIQQFGFRVPILIDSEGVIISGHTRLRAAQQLELTEVPCHIITDLSPAQVAALRLADNKVSEISQWDKDLLSVELTSLQGLDFDLRELGFRPDELEQLLGAGISGNQGNTDPDAVPLPPDAATSKRGDIYILGSHRLMCGDSSSPEDVDKLLAGVTIQLVNTDPPYNVKVEPRSNNAIAAGNSSFEGNTNHQSFDLGRYPGKSKATTAQMRPRDRPLENDFVSDEAFNTMLNAWFGNMARVLEPGCAFYIFGGYGNIGNYPPALEAAGLYFSQAIIWDKEWPVLTRKDFMGAHEWMMYGWREGAAHRYFGPTNATDLWHIKKTNPANMVHLTEKPVELAVRAMQYSSQPGENVLDLFGGSGSTLIAAEMTGRKAFLMEIDPPYCDVIVRRWEEFTAQKAVLEKAVA